MSDPIPSPVPPASTPLPTQIGLSFTPKKVGLAAGIINSIAVLGKDKSGKTTFGASASEIPQLKAAGKKTLIMESEMGYASVAERYPDAEQFSFTNAMGFEKAIDELLTRRHDYGVVVLDTYDKFQQYRVDFELARGGVDTRASYGRARKWTMDTAWRLHKAPFTTIFLFHVDNEKDERTGMIDQTYKLVGSAGKEIGEVFDGIFYLQVEDDASGTPQRVLQLGPKPGLPTGNRWESKLPPKMVNATMSEIVSLIRSDNTTKE